VRQARHATLEAARANAVQAFMTDLFRANSSHQADPLKARQTTALELLDLGAAKIPSALDDAPSAKLQTLELFGELYDDLAVNDRAVELRKQAVTLARDLYGADDPRVASELMDLDYSLRASSHVNERAATLDEAERILDAAHDDRSRLRAHLLHRLADYYNSTDRPRALKYAERAVALNRALGTTPELATALYTQGQVQENLGLAQAARESLKEGIDILRRDHNANAELTQLYATLGEVESELDLIPEAEDSYRRALASARATNGEDHVDTLQTEMRLGKFLTDTGRMHEGLTHLANARAIALRVRGPDDPFHTPTALVEYGWGMVRYGELAEGLADIEAGIANRRRNRPGTQYLAAMLDDAAFALVELGRFDEALRNVDESRAIKLKFEKPPAAVFNHNVVIRARLAQAQGLPGEAADVLGEYKVYKAARGVLSRTQLEFDLQVAEVALAFKDYMRAADVALSARERLAASALAPYLRGTEARAALCEGRARLALGFSSDAVPLLERAAAIRDEDLSPKSAQRAEAHAALAEAYAAAGRPEDARRSLAEARAILARGPQVGPQYTQRVDSAARVVAAR
jgi:serine/threonine-protein kinase